MLRVYEVVNVVEHVFHYMLLDEGVVFNENLIDNDVYEGQQIDTMTMEDGVKMCNIHDMLVKNMSEYGPRYVLCLTQEAFNKYANRELSA